MYTKDCLFLLSLRVALLVHGISGHWERAVAASDTDIAPCHCLLTLLTLSAYPFTERGTIERIVNWAREQSAVRREDSLGLLRTFVHEWPLQKGSRGKQSRAAIDSAMALQLASPTTGAALSSTASHCFPPSAKYTRTLEEASREKAIYALLESLCLGTELIEAQGRGRVPPE